MTGLETFAIVTFIIWGWHEILRNHHQIYVYGRVETVSVPTQPETAAA
jgi:hypothetical protein